MGSRSIIITGGNLSYMEIPPGQVKALIIQGLELYGQSMVQVIVEQIPAAEPLFPMHKRLESWVKKTQ